MRSARIKAVGPGAPARSADHPIPGTIIPVALRMIARAVEMGDPTRINTKRNGTGIEE